MRITKFLPVALAAGVLFTSCNKEDAAENGLPQGEVAYAKVIITEGSTNGATRAIPSAPGNAQERNITSLELYVFEADGSRDQNEKNGGYASYTGDEVAGTSKIVAVTGGSAKRILVAANMNLGKLEGKNLDAVKAELSKRTLPGESPLVVPAAGIPMGGVSGLSQIIADETAETEIPVTLNRLYSRLNTPVTIQNVVVEIPSADLDTVGLDPEKVISFTFEGYAVVNGLNDSYVISELDLTGWSKATGMTYHSSVYDAEGHFISSYSGKKNDSFFLSNPTNDYVYVYENVPATKMQGGTEVKVPETVYAMIVKGTLSDGNEDVTRYWRLNLAKEEDYSIYRNAQYNTEIQAIKTIGYGNPKDAEEEEKPIPGKNETGIIAKISIAEWRIFNGSTDL